MLHLTNKKNDVGGGYSLILQGDELQEVAQLFEHVPHIKGDGFIEFPNNKLSNICDTLSDYELSSEIKTLAKRINECKPPLLQLQEDVKLPVFKLQPHTYQAEAVKYGIAKKKFLLADDMGLGKTGAMIYFAEILKAFYGFKHALVVCGINGAKFNWHQIEVPKFSYESSHIIGSRVNARGNFVIGDIPERIADLKAPHDEFYLIINVESLRSEEISDTLQEMIVSGEIGIVIIDEVHKCSGASSEQGKAIHKLMAPYRVGLTGTPIYNKPFDLYNILKWLGKEGRTLTEFKEEYAYPVPTTMKVKGRMVHFVNYVYKDLSLLHHRLKDFMLRRTVDFLNLPEPIFIDEYVELGKKQLALYNKIKDDILKANNYDSFLSPDQAVVNPGVEFTKARQAVSCPSEFGISEDAKLSRVLEIVEEAIDNGRSVVIFGWFNATVRTYYDVLRSKYGDNVLGVLPDTKNPQDVITAFQTSSAPQVLIGSIGKLGTSYTITRADMVIFVDKHVVWSDYKQAYMRVWRQGQKKTVVIINIMAKDTIDERLEHLLTVGRSHGEQIVDGKSPDKYIEERYSIDQLL